METIACTELVEVWPIKKIILTHEKIWVYIYYCFITSHVL
jgi:hypothetical protein